MALGDDWKPAVGERWRWRFEGYSTVYLIKKITGIGEARGCSDPDTHPPSCECCWLIGADIYAARSYGHGYWELIEDEFTAWTRRVRNEANQRTA